MKKGSITLIKYKKRIRFFSVLTIIFWGVFIHFENSLAQNISIPDTLRGWDQIWIANLHGSQATYNNWSQGGASSVSGTGSTVFSLLNRVDRKSYGFRVNLKYGRAYVNGDGMRKTDDVINVRNRFTQQFIDEEKLSLYASTSFQTQFDKGYDFGAGVAESDSLISDFMSPAYLSESMGIAFNPIKSLTMESGVGLKQTIIADGTLSENYGLEPGSNVRYEGGLSTGIDLQSEIFSDIHYNGSLETFTNLLNGLKKTDIIWSNELKGEINKSVNALLQFDLKYDDDFSKKLQLKQVLSVGVSLNFF